MEYERVCLAFAAWQAPRRPLPLRLQLLAKRSRLLLASRQSNKSSPPRLPMTAMSFFRNTSEMFLQTSTMTKTHKIPWNSARNSYYVSYSMVNCCYIMYIHVPHRLQDYSNRTIITSTSNLFSSSPVSQCAWFLPCRDDQRQLSSIRHLDVHHLSSSNARRDLDLKDFITWARGTISPDLQRFLRFLESLPLKRPEMKRKQLGISVFEGH